MPVFFIVAIVFGSLLLGLKMVFDFQRDRQLPSGDRGDRSLPVSELRELIREAVDEALDPVVERLERLEGPPALPESRSDSKKSD